MFKSKSTLWTLMSVLLVLVVVRASLPFVVKWYANNTIDEKSGISGHIEDVDLALIIGAYDFVGIEIFQEGSEDRGAILAADLITVQLSWMGLMRGEIVSNIHFESPQIRTYDTKDQTDVTSPEVLDEQTWLGMARNLTPFSIDELSVNDGSFTFSAFSEEKNGGLEIFDIRGSVTDLHNDEQSELLASALFEGKMSENGSIAIAGRLNPNTSRPTFDINLRLLNLSAAVTDDIVTIYAPFDLEAGNLDVAAELVGQEGKIDGYIKAGIHDLEVFSWHEDFEEDVLEGDQNPLSLLVEGVSAMLTTLFENDKRDLVATTIPIDGTLDDPDPSLFEAFLGLLENAFIEALEMDIDHLISFETEEESNEAGE